MSENQNPIAYLWNELLFARYFDYHTPLPPEKVIDRLQGVTEYPSAAWGGIDRDVVLLDMHYNPDGSVRSFRFKVTQRRIWQQTSDLGTTTASATGSVYQAPNGAHITGETKLGSFSQVGLIVFAVFIALITISLIQAPFAVAFIGWTYLFIYGAPISLLFLAYWFMIYRDRNHLGSLLLGALPKEQRKAHRLYDSIDDDPVASSLFVTDDTDDQDAMPRRS